MEYALVSGGAGFIGSHLCAALVERGYFVLCVDNLSTGSLENIASLTTNRRFRFLQQDVLHLDRNRLKEHDLDHAFRYVFHLASPASVVDYLRLPLETLLVNSQGTQRLLDLARDLGAGFVYTSTSEIYGDPLVHPQSEEYWGNVNPNGPRSCYDEGKRFGEAITAQYVRSFGLDARIVRIFNTYGPHSRADDGRVVPNFVAQTLQGKAISIYGSGLQTRSFCFVSDLVAGLISAMLTPGQVGEVFNLGNPEEHTILEFAQIVSTLCGSADPELVWSDLPADDPSRRRPDIQKASSILGWVPTVSLEDGLRATIDWFRPRLQPRAGVGAGATVPTS